MPRKWDGGLHKRCKCDRRDWGKCDHIWCTRFTVGGVERVGYTGETDRGRARQRARALRVAYEQRVGRLHGGGAKLRVLLELDLERVLAAKSGIRDADERIETLRSQWRQLLKHFGPERAVESIELRELNAYVDQRKAAGQTIRREVQTLLRGLRLARGRGLTSYVLPDTPIIRNAEKNPQRAGRRLDWAIVDAFCAVPCSGASVYCAPMVTGDVDVFDLAVGVLR